LPKAEPRGTAIWKCPGLRAVRVVKIWQAFSKQGKVFFLNVHPQKGGGFWKQNVHPLGRGTSSHPITPGPLITQKQQPGLSNIVIQNSDLYNIVFPRV
jgi:hypothetical protein